MIFFFTVENKVISIETKCFFPEKKTEVVDDTTEANVQEYTFLIFSLFTDIVDRILLRQNITPIISQSVPREMGRYKGLNSSAAKYYAYYLTECSQRNG